MAILPNTPWFTAVLQVAGTQIPCLAGAALSCMDNTSTPGIVGNYSFYNFTELFQSPIAEVQFVPRDTAGEVLSQTFLNYFLSRTNDAAYDTSIIPGGLVYWDGRSGWTMRGVKADSITFNIAKGQLIGVSCRFCASNAESSGATPPGTPALQAISVAPTLNPWSNAPPLGGQCARFSVNSASTSEFFNWSLTFSNNHTPDQGMDGSVFPRAQNAGMPTCSVTASTHASAIPSNGFPGDDGSLIDILLSITGYSSGTLGTNLLQSGGIRTCVIETAASRDNNRKSRVITQPRNMRQRQYIAFSTDGRALPVSMTSTNF